jgi:hypothetical protein
MIVSDSRHSLLDYECLLFCVTDLVLTYESVISSAATDLNHACLTIQSFFSARLLIESTGSHGTYLLPASCHGNMLTARYLSLDFYFCLLLRERVFGQPLATLFRLSGVMSQYIE